MYKVKSGNRSMMHACCSYAHGWLTLVVLLTASFTAAATVLPPAPPLQQIIESNSAPTVAPLVSSLWVVGAVSNQIVAAPRQTGTQAAQARPVFTYNTTSAVTMLVGSRNTTTSFAVVAGPLVYCFTSNASAVMLAGIVDSTVAAAGASFDMFSVTPTPLLVVNDTLFIGTSNANTDAWVYAIRISLGAPVWASNTTGYHYANFPHIAADSGVMVQVSTDGSSAATLMFSLSGVFTNVSVSSSDTSDYRGVMLTPTLFLQARFSITIYSLPTGPGGGAAAELYKATFSSIGCVGIMDPIVTPIVAVNGFSYTTCLNQLFVVSFAGSSVTYVAVPEPNSENFIVGAYYKTSSVTALYYGTRQGSLYRVDLSTNTLVSVYTDSLSRAAYTSVGTSFGLVSVLVAYPPVSGASLSTRSTESPFLVATALTNTSTTTVVALQGASLSTTMWRMAQPSSAVTLWPRCDGTMIAWASSLQSPSTKRYRALQAHTLVPLSLANQTVGLSPVQPYFGVAGVSSLLLPSVLLGSLYDLDASQLLVVTPTGLSIVDASGNVNQACPLPSGTTQLAAAPIWVYKRQFYDVNQTVNITTQVTVRVNSTNTTTNVTTTSNITVPSWRLGWNMVRRVNATKALCVLYSNGYLLCRNTSSTSPCASQLICDVSSAQQGSNLFPVSVGDGRVITFCTGRSATSGAAVIDVAGGMTVSRYGNMSTAGIVGTWSNDTVFIPEEITGAAPGAPPERKRHRLTAFVIQGGSTLWSVSLQLGLASNVALLPPSSSRFGGFVGGIASSVSASMTSRSYWMALINATDGALVGSRGGSLLPAVVFSSNAAPRDVNLSLSFSNLTVGVGGTGGSGVLVGHVVASTFIAVLNVSALIAWRSLAPSSSTGRMIVPLIALQSSLNFGVGAFLPMRATPIVAADKGVGVLVGRTGVLCFDLLSATAVWQWPTAVSDVAARVLLVRVNNSIATVTPSASVALIDIRSGTQYVSATMPNATTVTAGWSDPTVIAASISEPTDGLDISSATLFAATAFTTDMVLFAAPFNVFSDPMVVGVVPLAAQAGPVLGLRSPTASSTASQSVTDSPLVTPTRERGSRTQSTSRDVTATASKNIRWSKTVNPLQSRTKPNTPSMVLSGSDSLSVLVSASRTPTTTKELKRPTKSGSSDATKTFTVLRVSATPNTTASPRLSPTHSQSEQVTITESVTQTSSISSSVLMATVTTALTPTKGSLTLTSTSPLTATKRYTFAAPTPPPTLAPPVLAPAADDASYGWVAGPALAIIALVGAIAGAVVVAKRKAEKRRKLREMQDAEEQGEMNSVGYSPPLLQQSGETDRAVHESREMW